MARHRQFMLIAGPQRRDMRILSAIGAYGLAIGPRHGCELHQKLPSIGAISPAAHSR
ncbi:hypothetical protein [Paenibacillus sp. MER TA 81-3]|uniref:hypothetical protein n=1 Tax=Paenibacillus sp. MER TA 81-3 TaxID=2939573 RepID=UPI002041E007|nr:hypothetical protein [Paenibacillus sp. MER TA 81-3]